MVNVEETKRYKAKQMRYKKSIAKDLNLDKIKAVSYTHLTLPTT